MEKFKLPDRFSGFGSNVWEEYNRLDVEYSPLNLGVGFPNFEPRGITNALAMVATGDDHKIHQYTRAYGHQRLVVVLTKLYSKILNRNINSETEILITYGAQQALCCAISSHIEYGDEAIIIEPYYDVYGPVVKMAGGVPRFIPLRLKNKTGSLTFSSDWVLDTEELEVFFNEKTKIIILNTPHNPVGKVFTLSELEIIANLCKKWNVLCISDEVYEWLVFEPTKHIRISTLPDMWERTITIGSAGKTFFITGWRVGWVYGGAKILRNIQIVHQNCVFTCTTPMQEALAIILEKELSRFGNEDSYFVTVPKEWKKKRDYMVNILRNAGMEPSIPDGGYFILADWSSLISSVNLKDEKDKYKDYRFTKWLCRHAEILGMPPSAFYSDLNKHLGESFVRFCFIKTDEDLKRAEELFSNFKKNLK